MKILEKIINEDSGGHCLLSCITIEKDNKLHFFFYSTIEEYSHSIADKRIINMLKESKDALDNFGIDGEYRYIDIFICLDGDDIFNKIESSIVEDDYLDIEKFLMDKIKEKF